MRLNEYAAYMKGRGACARLGVEKSTCFRGMGGGDSSNNALRALSNVQLSLTNKYLLVKKARLISKGDAFSLRSFFVDGFGEAIAAAISK
jgi:hypothetical protein